jgi:hypothetical protein
LNQTSATNAPHPQPWATGPGEILRHGLGLLRNDTDTNRRLAIISIDNAVELMVKTYLGLPKRVTGLTIPRNELQEVGESFPRLMDALEKYASDKLDGVDLATVEWYHRIRNKLYHEANGLTVERDKIEIYAELANILYKNLFGQALVEERSRKTELLGEFLAAWAQVERGLRALVERDPLKNSPCKNWKKDSDRFSFKDKLIKENFNSKKRLGILDEGLNLILRNNLLDAREFQEIEEILRVRNRAVHGHPGWEKILTREMVHKLQDWAKWLNDISGIKA